MSIAWGQSLERTLQGVASREEFVHAITHWFTESLAQEPEDSFEAIGRRISWVFADGVTLTVGTDFPPTICWMSKLASEDNGPPFVADRFGPWTFARYANGWELEGGMGIEPEGVVEIVDSLSEASGPPRLVLPWGHLWTEIIADQEDEYFESYDSDFGDDPHSNPYRVMSILAHAVMDQSLAAVSPWPLTVCEPDDFMSEYSDWSRFHRVVERITSENLLFVRLDQYSSATIDPAPEGMDKFVTWGADGAVACLGNGFISSDLKVSNLDGENLLKVRQIASEEGFENYSTVVGDEWSWTPGLTVQGELQSDGQEK